MVPRFFRRFLSLFCLIRGFGRFGGIILVISPQVEVVNKNSIPARFCSFEKNIFNRRSREWIARIHIDVQLAIATSFVTIIDVMELLRFGFQFDM